MNMLPVKWEAMIRRIVFWVHVMRLGEGRLLKEVVREATKFGGRVQWVKHLGWIRGFWVARIEVKRSTY